MSSIDGEWSARRVYLNCGYTSVWTITTVDESQLVVSEQCGSHCCGCVLSPCPKRGVLAHRMHKVDSDSWAGTLCGKPLKLTRKDDSELHHLTTDGPMIMTRHN